MFPQFPEVYTTRVENLSQAELDSLLRYVRECETYFDIVAERQRALDASN